MTLRKWRVIDFEERWRRFRYGEGLSSAVDKIKRELMHLSPYKDSYRDQRLRCLASRINSDADFREWGPALREACLKLPELGYYIRLMKAQERAWLEAGDAPPPGHFRFEQPEPSPPPLTDEQRRQVVSYLPLVAALATRWSPRSLFAVKRKVGSRIYRKEYRIDEANIHLREIGERCLENCVREYDPNRGVTFGAFARQRVAGAMVNYLQREKIPLVHAPADYRPKSIKPWNDKPVKRYRNSGGGFREQQYSSSNKSGPSRLISVGEAIETALQKLNPKQRAVYRGRILLHPPVSRAELARRLHIKDETQISRIERQAKNKMKQLLKPKSVTPF